MSTSNKTVIVNDTTKKNNLWCKVCNFIMYTAQDIECDNNFGCCEECWLSFGQMRQKEWKEGWRPDSETLNRYIQARRIINIDIMKILGE